MFFYLLSVICVGNFIDYVPTRAFSPVDDMSLVEKGLRVSLWDDRSAARCSVPRRPLAPVFDLLPDACQRLFSESRLRQRLLVILSSFLIFVVFAAAGLESGVGVSSHSVALIFIFLAFPVLTLAAWPRPTSTVLKLLNGTSET